MYPFFVNFIELFNRFDSIWRIQYPSVFTVFGVFCMFTFIFIPFLFAIGFISFSSFLIISFMLVCSNFISAFPSSSLDRSNIFVIKSFSLDTSLFTVFRISFCLSFIFPIFSLCSSCTKLFMTVSGVFSSCAAVLKKFSFILVASFSVR